MQSTARARGCVHKRVEEWGALDLAEEVGVEDNYQDNATQ